MTPSILNWLATVAGPMFAERRPRRVLEVGSLNVNGSARSVLAQHCGEWLGIDRQPGAGVDHVGEVRDMDGGFDAVVATEALEHDSHFWLTLGYMKRLFSRRDSGLLVITTPANGFPYHGWPNDYYRFTEDAYRDVFFHGMNILDLRTVDGGGHEKAVCGIAELR